MKVLPFSFWSEEEYDDFQEEPLLVIFDRSSLSPRETRLSTNQAQFTLRTGYFTAAESFQEKASRLVSETWHVSLRILDRYLTGSTEPIALGLTVHPYQDPEQHQERAVKSPGPLTPNRPLIGSEIPMLPAPQRTTTTSTHVPFPSNGPADTLPQIPTTTQPAVLPSSSAPPRPITPPSTPISSAPPKSPTLRPSVSISKPTVFITTTRPQSSVLPSPTNTVFITAAPQTITVTAPSVPLPSNDLNGDSGSKPQPQPQPSAIGSTQGVSFTSGSGVAVLGVLGGIAAASILAMAGLIFWRKRKNRNSMGSGGILTGKSQ
ncbi:hypothetical protein CSIM01_11569 [Colletotrichum simmondsii]|uniref:Uncharacterized protein n=1 Tax=Colletotrichum simmondsii TaxID=703756 RepID=A0A135RVL9_9PEZI|nr:hypothetical protein CSIM01_11569 [Colletotrichum simmondsii]